MLARFLKKLIFWGGLAALLYFLMGYHYIILDGWKLRLLKKSEFTLEQTIFSTHAKSNEKILEIDSLRRNGIAEILVEEGFMSESEANEILSRYDD